MVDPASARDFYINQLNFKPIANDPMSMHMPGESGQEIEILPATAGTHARITLGTMEEMTKAVQVFGDVLAKKSTAAA